jgi:hypothetical protein
MFLPSLDPVREEVAAGRARPVNATQGVAVVWQSLSAAEYERLHAGGVCQGCFFHFDREDDEGQVPHLSKVGLYVYGHLTENWISGPYGRAEIPTRPVHIDQLPPELRRQVKAKRFDSLRFADTPHIQPVEHGPCVSWEPAYLDVTCRHIRPIPGQEEEYAERYDELREDGEFEVEPPEDHTPPEDAE